MLKRENRLGKTSDIQKVLAKGRNFFNPFFTVKFLPQKQDKKFTVVVSSKVFKRAVARNRLKRIVREHLRQHLDQFKNGSYVIIARQKINRAAEKEILPSLAEIISRIRWQFMKKVFNNIININTYLLIFLIDIYQSTLSPDHSWLSAKYPFGFCRHYPSCSEYARQAILKFGVFKGGRLSAKRLLRCHPWAKPKVDLIPVK